MTSPPRNDGTTNPNPRTRDASMHLLQNVFSLTGYLLAIASMVAAARDARTIAIVMLAGPAILSLIFGYAGPEPFTAAHMPINDSMMGVVMASVTIHVIRLINGDAEVSAKDG